MLYYWLLNHIFSHSPNLHASYVSVLMWPISESFIRPHWTEIEHLSTEVRALLWLNSLNLLTYLVFQESLHSSQYYSWSSGLHSEGHPSTERTASLETLETCFLVFEVFLLCIFEYELLWTTPLYFSIKQKHIIQEISCICKVWDSQIISCLLFVLIVGLPE